MWEIIFFQYLLWNITFCLCTALRRNQLRCFWKKKENRICVDYVRCAPNNVVRFRSSLMAAAGALITTKYGPISPPVLDRFTISSQPAYCRRRTRWPLSLRLPFFHQPTYPFCRISTTSWAPPWRRPLDIEREIRFSSTTKLDRTEIFDKLFITRYLWREEHIFSFLFLNLCGRWNEVISKEGRGRGKEIIFCQTYRFQLIEPSKKRLTPCGCVRHELRPNDTG